MPASRQAELCRNARVRARRPVRLHGIREAVRLRTPAGETVLDFGENLAGILRVTGALPHGKTLVMEHGELLQDGCFCRDNLRTARAAEP